jgi:glutathione peroxidase
MPFSHAADTADEKPQSLCQYAGRVVLVVNTASDCGYTEQYRDLEAVHEKYQKKGMTVLGFPSNDFGGQEPKNNRAIADLCTNTFGVKFPMFAKSQVIRNASTNASPFDLIYGRRWLGITAVTRNPG